MATVGDMDDARKVIDRLARIDALDREQTPADVLLAEVRSLLHEAESWVRSDAHGDERACDALDRCRLALGDTAAAA